MTVERFTLWRQREVLTALTEQDFLQSAECAALLEQFEAFFAGAAVAAARREGFYLEKQDIAPMMLLKLLNKDGLLASYAATADVPWNYIGQCLKGWVREEHGVRGMPIEYADYFPPSPQEPTNLTDLGDVVGLTFDVLSPLVDLPLHGDLRELLGWLAANPLQRLSYEAEAKRAAHRHCPSFTIDQVIAVMNIAWGGRPRQEKTSFFGEFLLDSKFRPSDSPTHMRALVYFKNAMRAGAEGSKRLADWSSR